MKVTGDPSDQVARDLQLVEFVNQKTMGDTIESLLEVNQMLVVSALEDRFGQSCETKSGTDREPGFEAMVTVPGRPN